MAIVGSVALLALGGCATHPPADNSSPALTALNKAAQNVATQLHVLAATQQATAPGPSGKIFPTPETGATATPITLDWSGPLQPAVKAVAGLIGYQFSVIGNPPPTPILVNVSVVKRPAFSVLQNIGMQAGDAVGVVIRPGKKMVAVVYKGQSKGAS